MLTRPRFVAFVIAISCMSNCAYNKNCFQTHVEKKREVKIPLAELGYWIRRNKNPPPEIVLEMKSILLLKFSHSGRGITMKQFYAKLK